MQLQVVPFTAKILGGDKNIVFSDNISMEDAQAAADLAFGESAVCEEEI